MILLNPFLRWMERFYSIFIFAGSHLQSIFILWMRLTWGHQFMLTGLAKWRSIEKITEFLHGLQFPHSEILAYVVTISEVGCGLLLFIGFASRFAGCILSILMVVALSTAHAHKLSDFRFLTDPHLLVLQEPYPYLITAFLVFFFGPGRISIDACIKRWIEEQPRY